MPQQPFLADRITSFSLMRLLPEAISRRWSTGQPQKVYYLENGPPKNFLLKILERANCLVVEELIYSWADIKDPSGACAGFRVEGPDALVVSGVIQAKLLKDHPAITHLNARLPGNHLGLFLQKAAIEEAIPALMQINAVAWWRDRQSPAFTKPVPVYMKRVPWSKELELYANKMGIEVVTYAYYAIGIQNLWRGFARHFLARMGSFLHPEKRPTEAGMKNSQIPPQQDASVAASYHGKGLAFDAAENSEFFWLPFTNMPPAKIIGYCSSSHDVLSDKDLSFMSRSSLRIKAVNRSGLTSDKISMAVGPSWSLLAKNLTTTAWGTVLAFLRDPRSWRLHWWILSKLSIFIYFHAKWNSFFRNHGVKIHLSYNDWVKDRLAADQAIADLGGVSLSYQRFDESVPNIIRARSTDVHFVFSNRLAESRRQPGSSCSQWVVTGYPIDYAFARVKERSSQWRRRIFDKGARFIVCFLDENSSEDTKKGPSHEFRAENYRFLLERIFKDSSLGLILKPKKPATLRRRLGATAESLDRALASGRCVLLGEGFQEGRILPCEAGLAADAVIGLLSGTTAALECALSGSRTVLLDREGMPDHPLCEYQDRIVFPSWEDLWRSLTLWRQEPSAMRDFGYWGDFLDNCDPIRDGRAAERMGNYIGWLAQELEAGCPAKTALLRAGKKYAEVWGRSYLLGLGGSLPIRDEALSPA